MVSDFLTDMAAAKTAELNRLKGEIPLAALKRSIKQAPPVRSLNLPEPFGGLGLIAEVKKASPSAGDIATDLDPAALALEYQAGGAAAVSVLTESTRFGGSVQDLVLVRSRLDLPVLRKDFIIDPYDIYRSRGLGADLVLIIAAMLERDRLERLIQLALELSLTPLVEVHSRNDLKKVKGLPVSIIGVNNRDLKTLTVNLDTSFQLIDELLDSFPGCRAVAESGIRRPETAAELAAVGYSALLVGEYLVRSHHPKRAVTELLAAVRDASVQPAASIQGNQT
ncbi:indole-3-glycerol-phosphate synthase [candidate division KSB1 bacterium]